nr:hypothetical protein [Corynebacterium sp. HMSC076D02]
MRSYEEHLAAIRGALPAPTVVTRSLLEVDGLILARTIAAAYDMPRFNNSQMDGYAITTTEGGTFTVGQTVAAGAVPSAAQDGIATPIMTGAKVPEDTVTIVPVEQCEPPQFPREGGKSHHSGSSGGPVHPRGRIRHRGWQGAGGGRHTAGPSHHRHVGLPRHH